MTIRHFALRRHIYPRADFLARGPDRPARISDIILGMTLILLSVILAAIALTHLFTVDPTDNGPATQTHQLETQNEPV